MADAVSMGAASDTTAPAPSPRSRLRGIDAGRILFVYAVVVLHCSSQVLEAWGAILQMACRAAVPFFFIASGYFVRIPESVSLKILSRPFTRLAPIYLFWMTVYGMSAYFAHTAHIEVGIRALLPGDIAPPLWFLPALGFAMVVVPAGICLLGWRVTGLICAVLAGVAIGFGAYHDLLRLAGAPKRGGLLVAPMFLFIGCALAQRPWRPSLPVAAGWAMLAFAALLAEEYFIASRLNTALTSHDFSFGTFLYGTGAFLLARSLPEDRAVVWLASLGLYSLGIYLSHLLFIWTFSFLEGGSPWAVFSLSALSFSCALLLTMALRRIPYLRIVVT